MCIIECMNKPSQMSTGAADRIPVPRPTAAAGAPSRGSIGAACGHSPVERAETQNGGAAAPIAPTFHASFVRVVGEGFDADQVTLPCAECGLSEYSCECEIDVCPKCNRTEDAFGYCHCKADTGLTIEQVQDRIARVFLGVGR